MADAVISIVVERLIAFIEEQISYEVNLVRRVKEELPDLCDKLNNIKSLLDDAENKGVNDPIVKRWLKKLEDAAYEMDDILDEWNYDLLKHKMEAKQKVCCSFISSPSLCFKKIADRRKTAKKIQNVKAKLDEILKEGDYFKFMVSQPTTAPMPKPPRVQSTSSVEHEKVCGRDEDRNNIVRKLRLDGDSQILCIVGMGGIGKTTLAQLVFNDSRVKDRFDLTIWICVSDPFDVDGIARAIVHSVGKETIPRDTNQLELVLQKLKDSISEKKFLLVLDDVWTEKYEEWKPLKINLGYGAEGSKILVTTRNERVAKMMRTGNVEVEIYHPKQLTDQECWTVLRRISLSGRSEEECRGFEDVGKKIASKCQGLPLAANVLGSLLQFKNSLEEWENVLESEIWQLEKAEVELFPHLLLSYNELSPALKRCFSYCAVYPKDSRIKAERLIEEWTALGYLGSVSGNGGVELKGREYLNNLAMRSLFQDIEKSGEQIERCKMHDIVHDFARFLRKNNDMRGEGVHMTKTSCQVCDHISVSQAQAYRSVVWDKISPPGLCDCLKSLRVFKFKGKLNVTLPQGMEKLIHLRWLKLSGTKLSEEDLKIICRLYFLQTLVLKSCSLKEIPGEIGNLVQLRHLNLSRNDELKELPESLCTLLELQILFLKSCSLKEIPGEIGNLVQLRHLDLSGNDELKELPESLFTLLELQILNIERCSNLKGLPAGIHRLENLQHLFNRGTQIHCLPQGVAQLSGLRTLEEFHGGSGCNKLGLLKNFNRLTGSLALVIHSSSSSDLKELAEDSQEAKLRNKIHIQTLKIEFWDDEWWWSSLSSSSSPSPLWMDVIEALEPNHNLKILDIERYRDSRLPHWISSPLNLFKQIKLRDCSEVSSLPPMGKLPFLEVFHVSRLEKLKMVGREFLGIECSSSSSSSSNEVVVAFPKLEWLIFSYCNEWWEWEDITAEEEESVALSVMPCLWMLCINGCGGLKKLPHRLLRKASSSLEILDISNSSELQESYGNDGDLVDSFPNLIVRK